MLASACGTGTAAKEMAVPHTAASAMAFQALFHDLLFFTGNSPF
jgi:hypothetical protein